MRHDIASTASHEAKQASETYRGRRVESPTARLPRAQGTDVPQRHSPCFWSSCCYFRAEASGASTDAGANGACRVYNLCLQLRFCCPYMAWFAASTISAPLAGCEQAAKNIQKATSEVQAARLPA
eukprot:749-Heterococcus_DN1.PRE.4